ncbi:MAG: hypothetical protein JO360_02775 [Acidobacteria bacterium]|nr:hypothetical protein [Acidobacteriota bacterium]
MVGKKRVRATDERLDRLGSEIVRATAMPETEAESVAAAPFLYARLRARINAERTRREEGESRLAMLKVFWRAVPALALVAVFALALFWSSATQRLANSGYVSEAILNSPDSGIERTVFTDNQALSSDEVLATIYDGEAAK